MQQFIISSLSKTISLNKSQLAYNGTDRGFSFSNFKLDMRQIFNVLFRFRIIRFVQTEDHYFEIFISDNGNESERACDFLLQEK